CMRMLSLLLFYFFFFQAEDGIRDFHVTGVQTCALPIFGGALGVIRAGWLGELVEQVYVTESRPGREGSRLTAWELQGDGVPTSVCVDAAAGHLMKSERIGWLIIGAERIAANGDVAAPIGTYPLTVLAMHHGLRVMVAAASTCIDAELEHGDDLPLETRAASED